MRILRSFFGDCERDLNDSRHAHLRIASSVAISVVNALNIYNAFFEGALCVWKDSLRFFQSAVASDSFQESKDGRLDTAKIA